MSAAAPDAPTVVCAWCQPAPAGPAPTDGTAVSHGICPAHKADMERQLADLRASRARFTAAHSLRLNDSCLHA